MADILYCINHSYTGLLMTNLYSLKRSSGLDRLDVHVIHRDLDETDMRRIRALEDGNISISFIRFDAGLLHFRGRRTVRSLPLGIKQKEQQCADSPQKQDQLQHRKTVGNRFITRLTSDDAADHQTGGQSQEQHRQPPSKRSAGNVTVTATDANVLFSSHVRVLRINRLDASRNRSDGELHPKLLLCSFEIPA